MKLTAIDLEDDDIRTYNRADRPPFRLGTADTLLSDAAPAVVKYDYADMGATPYNFAQPFHHRDTCAYFARMKELTSATICDIRTLAQDDRSRHFHRSPLSGNVRRAMEQLFPGIEIDPCIIIYHFALYSDPDVMACRDTDTRCPRIYFLQGAYGFIYPLFFDPYHELNP